MNADTGETVACLLTNDAADDAGQVSALLEQTAGAITPVTADGAYDGEPVYQAIAALQSDPPPEAGIPPRASAVPSTEHAGAQSQRHRHIRLLAGRGRLA